MPKALIIYHGESADIRLIAEKVEHRLENFGMQVTTYEDKHFKDPKSVGEYDIIALGAQCLTCKKCHGAEECRAPKLLRRHLKKLFKMDLKDKKLITFTHSADPEKNQWISKRMEVLMAPTRIKPIASISHSGKPDDILEETIRTKIMEQAIR
jgi:menaquinone-dependent protoporphyrinogen IX oxidase